MSDLDSSAKPARKSSLPEWAKAGGGKASSPSGQAPSEYSVTGPMLAGAAGIALLAVLVAFGLGWQGGKRSATATMAEKHKAEIDRITRNLMQVQGAAIPTAPSGVAPASSPAVAPTQPNQAPTPPVARQETPPAGDPRTVGLNYWRLCQVPEAEAAKYAEFLVTEGQRTLRVPVAPGKAGGVALVTVYVVTHGYRGSSDRLEVEKSRTALLSLGDKWAKRNKGGNPFRSLMLEKYAGK